MILVLAAYAAIGFGQQTLTKTISNDGEDRSYILYIPASYSADKAAPLVLNFHGYGSSALDQMRYGDFRYVADTAGFIIVHPQGAVYEGSTHWNVGSWVAGSPYDDVSFTEAVLDEVESNYTIDGSRIYSTGMSNGGYMSFLLACQLSDRIAAVASVTGSMTPNNLLACNPQRPVPVLQIHGTNDAVVPYEGALWTQSVASVLDYWTEENNCDPEPITFELPDVNVQDGSMATFYRYEQGDAGSVVEHIKINGGRHTWPGTAFATPGTNLDFLASDAIWKFFLRYDIDGLVTAAKNVQEEESIVLHYHADSHSLQLFGAVVPSSSYAVYDNTGTLVRKGSLDAANMVVDDLYLPVGTYIFSLEATSSYKFIVTH